MPNWCSNTLTIQSTEENISKIKTSIEKTETEKKGLLQAIAPIQEEQEDWYLQNVESWGTKWDVPFDECFFILDSPDSIYVSFTSAWSPPLKACKTLLETLTKTDPSALVRCTFDEPGCDFIGYWENEEEEVYSIVDLYSKLIDKDPKAISFLKMNATYTLEELAENFFCIDSNSCRCYNCDPINPIKGYQNESST